MRFKHALMPVMALLAMAGATDASAKAKPRHRAKARPTESLRTGSGGVGAAGGQATNTGSSRICPTPAPTGTAPSTPSTTPPTGTAPSTPSTTPPTGTAPSTPSTPPASGATSSGQSATTAPANATTLPGSGGAGLGAPVPVPCTPAHPTVPGFNAEIIGGLAYAPAEAPAAVQRAIWAGNAIRFKPYIWGGGHGSFKSAGYDCSGSVSYVLHAAGLLSTPMDSSTLMGWGTDGLGGWITVYANPSHAFIEIAGIRFDTSAEADPKPPSGSGPRWRPLYPNPPGFTARHPLGY